MVTASSLEIRGLSVEEILAEGPALFREHWREIAQNRDTNKLALDDLRYKALETSGSLIVLAARDGPKLVGYSIAILNGPHLHDAEMFCAVSDALFVTKPYRNTGIGARLIRDTETVAKECGATTMVWHAMKDSDLDIRMSRSTRYQVQDVSYTRTL